MVSDISCDKERFLDLELHTNLYSLRVRLTYLERRTLCVIVIPESRTGDSVMIVTQLGVAIEDVECRAGPLPKSQGEYLQVQSLSVAAPRYVYFVRLGRDHYYVIIHLISVKFCVGLALFVFFRDVLELPYLSF